MVPEDLRNQIVDTGAGLFQVITALELNPFEWSLVGFCLDENQKPQTPHAEHLMIDPSLLRIVDGNKRPK